MAQVLEILYSYWLIYLFFYKGKDGDSTGINVLGMRRIRMSTFRIQ